MPFPHCEWVEGELRIVGLKEIVDSNTKRPKEVDVAPLRLKSPRAIPSWHMIIDRPIRARATESEQITTFLRSLEIGSPRIILTPTIAVDEHGGVVVNLDVHCELNQVAAGQEFEEFWKTAVRRVAMPFAERLSMGIQEQLFGYGFHP